MSLAMLCFPCCIDEQPPPTRQRPKIDRSQIGLPTNFQHTGHIGSGEVAQGFDVHQVQNSMQSKGGYEQVSTTGTKETTDGLDLTNNTPSYNTSSPNEVQLNINTKENSTVTASENS